MAAGSPKKDLGAAILVEEDRSRTELLRLRGKEIENDRLARPGWTDDRKVAEIALVEVEEVGVELVVSSTETESPQ